MYVKRVLLENFRNYQNQEIEFVDNINIIYGDNAQGKTSILEAIFLCSMGKSFRSKKDSDLIKFNEKKSKAEIQFVKLDREGSIVSQIENQKTFFINGVKQNKISDIIGKVNVVIFTPNDIDIIEDGPQRRRKYIDMMISSLKPNYIHLLNNYNKVLEQRNNYLKQIKLEKKPEEMLEIWDEQLAELSSKIYEYRNVYIKKISEKIKDIHNMITNCGKDTEEIKIKYISTGDNKEVFLKNILKSRKIDIQKGYTSVGIHRDDLIIYINHKPVSVFGSRGQKRTVVLSLKLSELAIVSDELNGDAPILLLDDFMSELDKKRRTILLEKIKGYQVIITCTDEIDINCKNKRIFYVDNGICVKKE